MKVLITGAAGFIGSRLAEALIAHDHEVVGIDNLATGRYANYPEPAKLIVGDIVNVLPEGPFDLIYHAAASYRDRSAWEADTLTNVLGTIKVVRKAQESNARLVYFQTALCYGASPQSPVPIDAPLDPHGSYAVSKTAGESYIRDSGLDYVSLRLANIYGPRNLSGPIPTFYKRLSSGQECTVVDSRRDFVFVDDLVWVAVNAATKGSGVYHISSGTDYSIAEVYEAVSKATRAEGPAMFVPRGDDDNASLLLDPSDTEREFGWKATTSLEDGITRAVEWYSQVGVKETYTHLAMKG